MADAFDRFEGRDSAKADAFDQFPIEQESFGKSAARSALQIPQGIAEGTPPGILAGLFQFLAQGETELSVEDWQSLRKAFEQKGESFDEDAYERGRQQALSYIPTVSNIAREVESRTGLPLEPKNRLQKGLRFASTASKVIPKPNPTAPRGYAFRGTNTGLPRPVLGAGVEGVRETLIELGIPEPIADLASFAAIKPTTDASNIFKVGPSKKESGLTNRRYEKLEKPTEVSQATINKINETTEREFRDLTNKIIEKSPIKETHQALANDVTFKKNAAEAFKDVEILSETLPKTFETKTIKLDLENFITKKKNEGLTPSEFDKAHNKFIEQYIKETPDKPFTAKELVKQYRKNNQQLSEAYEPGQSFAYNRAKREALLDYNKSISNIIEKEFPNSQFSNLFKETNKKWADISNSESISKFLDQLFTGKTNFTKARQLFDKEGMTVPFKRAMGNEGFAKFETLLNDLLSTEKGNKLLKAAEQKGFGDLAKTAGAYILHPSAAKAKLGYDTLKGGYKKIFEMLLDKPQLAVTWDKGINAMKRGDFKAATKELSTVKAAENAFDVKEKSRIEALKKFNEQKAEKSKELAKKPTEEIKQPKKEIQKQSIEPPEKFTIDEIVNADYVYNPKLGRKEFVKKPTKEAQKQKKLTKEEESHLFGEKKTQKENRLHIKKNNKLKHAETSQPQPTNKSEDLRKSQRDILKDILDLRKEKKSIKGNTREFRNKRGEIEDKIKSAEKEFYKNKKEAMPDLEKRPPADISPKSLKTQRDFIINSVEKAIKNPPNTEKITIDVPGDGVFKIWNIQDVLEEFMGKVKKDWPVKQLPKLKGS